MNEGIILIYAKYDINMSIIDICSNIFLQNIEGYTQIDQWTEGQDRYIYAHADNGEYVMTKYGKPLYDEQDRPNFHDNFVEWTEEEKNNLNIESLKLQKRQELSNTCNQTIINGIDVELSIGTKHFSLTTEDQINLFGKQSQLLANAEQLEYHADGEECIYFSKEDMSKIIESAMAFVTYNTTYCNSLYLWLNSVKTKTELDAITYGADIPEEYQNEVLKAYIKSSGKK